MCILDQRQIHNLVQPNVTSNAMVPMERICVDSIGELPSSGEPNSYKHILVVLVTFTRWVELYPLRSTDAVEAADSLLQFFTHWNTPTEMQSDRGSQFLNSLIEEQLCRRKDIAQVLSLPHSHQDNGRGHGGAVVITLGMGAVYCKSSKQKLVSKKVL
jgi:hypothetical protein